MSDEKIRAEDLMKEEEPVKKKAEDLLKEDEPVKEEKTEDLVKEEKPVEDKKVEKAEEKEESKEEKGEWWEEEFQGQWWKGVDWIKAHDTEPSGLMLFIDYMFKGDGSFLPNGDMSYFATQSKSVFDGMLNLLLISGSTFSYYIQKALGESIVAGKKSNCTKDIYRLYPKKSNAYHIRKKHITKEKYEGTLFNVCTENKTLLVERNGRFTWVGTR